MSHLTREVEGEMTTMTYISFTQNHSFPHGMRLGAVDQSSTPSARQSSSITASANVNTK
jgi:hypothetical protein